MSSKNRCNGAGNVRFENGSVTRVAPPGATRASLPVVAEEVVNEGLADPAGPAAREALLAAAQWAATRGGPLSGAAPFLRTAAGKAAGAPGRGAAAVGAAVYGALSSVDWSGADPGRPRHGIHPDALSPLSRGRSNPGDKENYKLEDVERYGRLAGRRVVNKGGSSYMPLVFMRWLQLAGPAAYSKALAAQWVATEPGTGKGSEENWTPATLVSALSTAATMAEFEEDAPFREASRYGTRFAADFSGASRGLFAGVAEACPVLPPGFEEEVERVWPKALARWEAYEEEFKRKTIRRIEERERKRREKKGGGGAA